MTKLHIVDEPIDDRGLKWVPVKIPFEIHPQPTPDTSDIASFWSAIMHELANNPDQNDH